MCENSDTNTEIKVAWLTTNRTCNNQCVWCYAQNAQDQIMKLENAVQVIDSLKAINIKKIVLIGGEPTIYPHFFEVLEYINKKHISISIVTNGRKFADIEFVKKCVDKGIKSINISLKAFTEDDYYKLTKSGGLNEAIKGYHNLLKYGFHPTLSYVVSNKDTFDIDKIISFIKKHSLDNLMFQFVKPVLGDTSSEIMPLWDMAQCVHNVYYGMKDSQINYFVELSFPLCLIEKDVLDNLIKNNRVSTGCHLTKGSGIIFDPSLNVLPCNHFVDLPFCKKNIGSVKDIFQLWNSPEVVEFRKTITTYPTHKCSLCEMWDICGGGCITRWFYIDPNDYIY